MTIPNKLPNSPSHGNWVEYSWAIWYEVCEEVFWLHMIELIPTIALNIRLSYLICHPAGQFWHWAKSLVNLFCSLFRRLSFTFISHPTFLFLLHRISFFSLNLLHFSYGGTGMCNLCELSKFLMNTNHNWDVFGQCIFIDGRILMEQ